jgi:hypothetical protein
MPLALCCNPEDVVGDEGQEISATSIQTKRAVLSEGYSVHNPPLAMAGSLDSPTSNCAFHYNKTMFRNAISNLK